jgi:Flp pilus assembly protein TadG
MVGRSRTLAPDQSGAAVIELALLAPVLALLTIGVVDMSNAVGHKLVLEQGSQRAIEMVMQTTLEDTVEGALKTEVVCQVNGVNPDGSCKTSPINTGNVTVTFTLECTNNAGTISTQASTNSTTFDAFTCGGGTVREARYLEVGVTDTYTPMFPIHFAGLGGDGKYHLSATAGMRTQ